MSFCPQQSPVISFTKQVYFRNERAHMENRGRQGKLFNFFAQFKMVYLHLEVVAFTNEPPTSFPAGLCFQIPVFPVYHFQKKKKTLLCGGRSNFPKSLHIIPVLITSTNDCIPANPGNNQFGSVRYL